MIVRSYEFVGFVHATCTSNEPEVKPEPPASTVLVTFSEPVVKLSVNVQVVTLPD